MNTLDKYKAEQIDQYKRHGFNAAGTAICARCKAELAKPLEAHLCQGCRTTHFCSKECSDEGWRKHKKYCKAQQKRINNMLDRERELNAAALAKTSWTMEKMIKRKVADLEKEAKEDDARSARLTPQRRSDLDAFAAWRETNSLGIDAFIRASLLNKMQALHILIKDGLPFCVLMLTAEELDYLSHPDTHSSQSLWATDTEEGEATRARVRGEFACFMGTKEERENDVSIHMGSLQMSLFVMFVDSDKHIFVSSTMYVSVEDDERSKALLAEFPVGGRDPEAQDRFLAMWQKATNVAPVEEKEEEEEKQPDPVALAAAGLGLD